MKRGPKVGSFQPGSLADRMNRLGVGENLTEVAVLDLNSDDLSEKIARTLRNKDGAVTAIINRRFHPSGNDPRTFTTKRFRALCEDKQSLIAGVTTVRTS